ncbi:hypothetical protein PYH37_001528 [Sinorhizobium numidicum]|uniref:Uncharacterized protein n=1 Tax=Sinorhizobium numidicum TaxID=680248 RepID=A0ABY8CTT1_9HYPH|nr:hypothetical protein [Sinorhizobium numidicum]WEX74143.1 hypothetical protein PYH37_001528 [Sinorhizobium numidicum]WEX80128.1 hypothetical protein PYH38_001529 [Sinorhizobium numidicum]
MARREELQTFVQSKGPLFIFALLTFCGMIFIWTAKLLDWHTTLVTFVPIGLMLVYFALSFASNGLRLHNEQAGDNLYYMGFLFTLSSLGVSLYRFAGEGSIDEIVRNFGVAVTSTIVGITLRILFNQMRRDPIDIERSVRHELAEMTRRVRTELDSSAREFSSYRRASNQMLSEGFEEIARQAERNGEAIRQAIEALSKEAIRPVRDAAENLAEIAQANNGILEERARATGDILETASSRLDAATNRLSEKIDAFGRAVEIVGRRLEEMRLPDQILRHELQPILASIKELSDLQFKRMEDLAVHDREQAERTEEALRPLGETATKLDRVADDLERASNATANGAKALDELQKKITSLDSGRLMPPGLHPAAPENHPNGSPSASAATQTSRIELMSSRLAAQNVRTDTGSQDEAPGRAADAAALGETESAEPEARRGWFRRW